MLSHRVFTGNVRSEVSTFVEQESIELITRTCESLLISGCMFYADGNFLVVLEGAPERVEEMYKRFSHHPSLSQLLVLADTKIQRRSFEEFTISFTAKDMDEPINNPVFLSTTTPKYLLPDDCPETTKLFAKSFLQVQRVA